MASCSQKSRPLGLRALKLQEDTDYEIATGRAEGERKAGVMSKTQCTSFSFSLQLVFPLPGASAWRWGKWDWGQGISSCPARLLAGEQPQHTDPFLLLWKQWEAAVSAALFPSLSVP